MSLPIICPATLHVKARHLQSALLIFGINPPECSMMLTLISRISQEVYLARAQRYH